jgi:hypothetical protein
MDRFREHLDTLGIGQVAEWDVLVFIYRYGTSLASADQISRLLGYNRAIVGAALETLSLTGLVQRSRNSHGVRLYQSAPAVPNDPRQRALEELMAEERQGRLLLIRHLQQAAAGKEKRERGGLHLA